MERVTNIRKEEKENERIDIIKTAISKLDEGQEITKEESKVIDWAYQELELTLPEEELVWEVDHENGVGVSTSTMSTRAVVTPALIRGSRTKTERFNEESIDNYEELVEGGAPIAIPNKTYSDGEGGTYNFKNMVSTYYFFIPGLEETTVGTSICDRMVPQGACYCDGYIFLTAYCQEENGTNDEGIPQWKSVDPSVVYVLNANTKEYITTMILPNKAHVGGIIYADGYLWIADTGSNSTGYVYYYNYSEIRSTLAYVLNNSSVTAIDLSKISGGKTCLGAGNRGSFLSTYKGYVCIGEYYKDADYLGQVYLYDPDKLREGQLPEQSIGYIPGNANGMVFYTIANKTYLLINANEGYHGPSFAYVYEVNSSTNAIEGVYSYKKRMSLPCMVEEAFICNGRVYFVFESAAYKYRVVEQKYYMTRNNNPTGPFESVIGDVCGLTTTFVFK